MISLRCVAAAVSTSRSGKEKTPSAGGARSSPDPSPSSSSARGFIRVSPAAMAPFPLCSAPDIASPASLRPSLLETDPGLVRWERARPGPCASNTPPRLCALCGGSWCLRLSHEAPALVSGEESIAVPSVRLSA